MIQVAPGPETRSSGGTQVISPIWSRSRSLVSDSTAITASRSAGSATRSKRSIGGKRLGTMRKQGAHRTRRMGSATRRDSVVATALRIEVAANLVEVGDVPGEHSVERRSAVERRRRVRTPHPGIGRALVGNEHLECPVDAEDVGQSLERVAGERGRPLALPLEVGGARLESEERHLLVDTERPEIGDAEEGAKCGASGGRERIARRSLGGD